MKSGIILSSDQSPPPITFPALTETKPKFNFFFFAKFKYALKIFSAAALDEL